MIFPKRFILVILLSTLGSLIALPQIIEKKVGEPHFFFSNKRIKITTIPFQLVNNLIVIPLSINNSDTLHFVLDSGLRTALITELTMADTLSLTYARQITIYGLGEGESLEAVVSVGNNVRIGEAIGVNQTLHVLLQNIFNLNQLMNYVKLVK